MVRFVLCEGAWEGACYWKRLAKILSAGGHEVYRPTYTGIGERSHLLSPEINLETHIQDVLGVIKYEELEDVVLVGHGYGGMVVTGVADRAGGHLRALVYLDAFLPEETTRILIEAAAR